MLEGKEKGLKANWTLSHIKVINFILGLNVKWWVHNSQYLGKRKKMAMAKALKEKGQKGVKDFDKKKIGQALLLTPFYYVLTTEPN